MFAPRLDTPRVTRPPFLLALALLLLLGCGGPSADDAGAPPDAPSCSALPFTAETGEGVADPLGASDGEVRAGRLSAAALPHDPDGLGRWREGDFVLANDRVGAIVSDVGPGELYDPYGGRLIGLARVEGGALDPADYNLALIGLGRFIVATESVGVVADGSDGGPAIVRATGLLAPVGALADLLDALVPGEHAGVPAALDYELAPGSEALDIYLSVRAGDRPVNARSGSLQAFFQAYRTPPWAPGTGFGDRTSGTRFIAFEGDGATSFAWTAPEGLLRPLIGTSGIDVLTSARFTVAACEEGRLHVGRMVIGGPGLPGVQAAVARIDETATRALAGSVVESDGSAAVDVRLHVTAADGEHLTRFRPRADGTFAIDVDPRAAELWAWRAGEPLVGPVAITEDVRVTMGALATLSVTATDEAGAALPVRVEVVPLDGAPPSAPELFGELVPGAGRSHVAFPTDGVVTLRVAPGRHRVTISRGPEYEREVTEVTLAAGEELPISAALARSVDTSGVMCADFHIHTHRSVDSSDPSTLKVAGLVADGLEIAIRSEHEWVSDFAPVIDTMGLSDFAFGIAGLELTTFTYGHFGVFPLVPDPARASGGAISWYDRLAPEVFDEVRARPEAPALIVNHPRAGGLRQGYFSVAGYDPATGSVERPELWDDELTLVEAFNGSDFERNREGTVRDWFSLLASGRRVFVVGSSDSHVITETPVGYPRTCLALGVDDPRALTATMVRDATLAGRSVVSGGIFLDVTGPDGATPGEEASGAGATAAFEVVVRAASWIDVDRLEVIVDGVTTETIPITIDDADPLEPTIRARIPVEADVAAGGSFVVFHAAGDEPFDTSGHRPFAVSNPIFLAR